MTRKEAIQLLVDIDQFKYKNIDLHRAYEELFRFISDDEVIENVSKWVSEHRDRTINNLLNIGDKNI